MSIRSIVAPLLWVLATATQAATFTVTNTNDANPGSLRWAINQANAAAGVDVVAFNIPGGGVKTIMPLSRLPNLTGNMNIDGTTQPGYAGTPLIEISGLNAPSGTHGLVVAASGVYLRALTVNRFAGQGVRIQSGSQNQVYECWIGLDASGTFAAGNGIGVWVEGAFDASIGPNNTISGNNVDGVRINGAGTTFNFVRGNRIGTNPAGTLAIANAFNGIVISGAIGNAIGGNLAADANVISGNQKNGIGIIGGASDNVIARNYIGVNASGNSAVPNGEDGIVIIDSPANRIGDSVAGTFNVISGNIGDGIDIHGAAAIGNIIQRNVIGLSLNGSADIGNRQNGIYIRDATDTRIGNGDRASGLVNLISGNDLYGIQLYADAHRTRIVGNRIGTEVNGTSAVANSYGGISIANSDDVHIGAVGQGNLISGNTSTNIYAAGISGLVVEANFIGTNAAGTAALGSGNGSGIDVLPSIARACTNTTIGGLWGSSGNLISGNGHNPFGIGVAVTDCPGSSIRGNRIGTNEAGTAAIPNANAGIFSNGSDIIIGSTDHGAWTCDRACNLISGNAGAGIELVGGAQTVIGNFIGTRLDGNAALGNTDAGINNRATLTLGGVAAGAGNLISGNVNFENAVGHGVRLYGTTPVNIQGNRIGTNAAGSAAVPNSGSGIFIPQQGTTMIVGGADHTLGQCDRACNLIAGNGIDGIEAGSNHYNYAHDIRGNYIGVNLAGTCLGNTLHGISMYDVGSGSKIGGTNAADANHIACNGNTGIRISGDGTNVSIRRNRIHDHPALGIDLIGAGPDGVSGNDDGDLDMGANGLQNFPVLESATINGGTLVVAGSLSSRALRDYAIDFFSTPACDSSGHGEGRDYLGSITVSTDGDGVVVFSLPLTATVVAGQSITATATGVAFGNTSEFSACITANTAAGTIALSSGSYSVNEGAGSANITLTRSSGTAAGASVQYVASNGTATAPADYTAVSGTVTFALNETAHSFSVPISNDTLAETNETIAITISTPGGGATLGAPLTATLTIVDNDAPPTLSIADRSCSEGNSGSSNCMFTISLSAASALAVSGNWSTASGGVNPATAGSDYTAVTATPWSIAAGSTSTTVNVSIIGDTLDEANEPFLVNLSNLVNAASSGNDLQANPTITDDDAAPTVSVADKNCSEGNSGTNFCAFTLSLSAASGLTVSGNYATMTGGSNPATADVDYTAITTPLPWSFAPGGTNNTVLVFIHGDTTAEPNEQFLVVLAGLSNATAAGSDLQATGTIINDDGGGAGDPGTLSLQSSSLGIFEDEGVQQIRVNRTAGSQGAISVSYTTVDDTATSDDDYLAVHGTLEWADGDSTPKTFDIVIVNDSIYDPNERLGFLISDPEGGATLGPLTEGTVYIFDDELFGGGFEAPAGP